MAKKRKAGRKRILALMLCIMTGLSLIAGGSYSKAADHYGTTPDGIRYHFSEGDDVWIVGYTGNSGDVVIPEYIEGSPVVGIVEEAFKNCTSLKSIKISKTVKNVDEYAFAGCANLESVEFPNSVKRTRISDDAFRDCPKLKSVKLPEGLETLGQHGFMNCSSLTAIEIPDSVTEFCTKIFDYCGDGFTIYCNAGSNAEAYAARNGIPCCANPFSDVKLNKYYTIPVLWAYNSDPQITSGTSDTTFEPSKTCNRAQTVTFIWRLMGCPEPKSSYNPFTDVKSGAYYYKAVLWAVENNITTGTSATKFSPKDPCSRGQFLTFLWRACGSPAPTNRSNPFVDVKSGKYYTDAVIWANENGITGGTDSTHFSPNASVTRGQAVTFLYRSRSIAQK